MLPVGAGACDRECSFQRDGPAIFTVWYQGKNHTPYTCIDIGVHVLIMARHSWRTCTFMLCVLPVCPFSCCIFCMNYSLFLIVLPLFSFPIAGICREQSCHPLVSRSTLWAGSAAHPTRPWGQWPSEFPPVALPGCWLWQRSPLLLVHFMIYWLYTHIYLVILTRNKLFIDIVAGMWFSKPSD